MPFTPYHFGPSGFIALAFRKWIDLPVFILANIIVDLEVLVTTQLAARLPVHRYFHTLLIGAAVGILWALAAYPLRNIFKKIMRILHIHYQTSLLKMLLSGILGVWLHVAIDSIYHWDVRPFWPAGKNPLHALINRQQIEALCLVFFVAAIVLWALEVLSYSKLKKLKDAVSNEKD